MGLAEKFGAQKPKNGITEYYQTGVSIFEIELWNLWSFFF